MKVLFRNMEERLDEGALCAGRSASPSATKVMMAAVAVTFILNARMIMDGSM